MFDRIAPIYDLMNTVMTVGIDRRWRRAAVRAARLGPGMRALDVACGTGRLTEAAARAVRPGGEAIGVDNSPGMIERARRLSEGTPATLTFVEADALALPFEAGIFDAVTIGFGLRNVSDYRRALGEMARVARRGGRVVVLEIAVPRGGPARALYLLWFRRVVPFLGRLLGRSGAYRYLPATVVEYPPPDRVAELMREVGLSQVRWTPLTGGFVTIHRGVRD